MFGWCFSDHKPLISRLETVERQLREQALDFEELYERCKRLLGRTVKERARIEAAAEPDGEGTERQSPSPANGPLPLGGHLTPRQRELQQMILRRRAGGA